VKKKKSVEAEADDAAADVTETGEDLRSRILARLQMDGVKVEGSAEDMANNEGADEDQQSLAEKIQERLSNLHKAVDSPEPTPEKAEKAEGGDDGDAGDDGTAMPPPVAAKGPKTKEDYVTLIQAQFRGTLIRTEQLNLLEASVKLLCVKDEQWAVLGQGTATVESGLKDPYVRVDGWLLSKRAWDSNKELLLEQNIDWMNGPTCETDEVGPPIFVLEQSEDNEIYGLEFALRGDETEFEEEYDVARRDAGAIRIQAVARGALARWELHGRPTEAKPEEPKAMTTPAHHPPLGSTIEVRRGMFKKKKIGKLIDFNNFTGQYKIQFDTGKVAKWYDLDKVTYKRLGTAAESPKTEEPEAAAAAAPAASADDEDPAKKKEEEAEPLVEDEDAAAEGLGFVIRGDETGFEEEYDVVRRVVCAIRIQAVVRGALTRRKLYAPKSEERTTMTTPSRHPPLGSTIEVKRGMFKRNQTGKLTEFNNLTGQYKIQFDTGKLAKWHDLDKITYKWLITATMTTAKTEEPEAAAAAAPDDEDPVKKQKEEEAAEALVVVEDEDGQLSITW